MKADTQTKELQIANTLADLKFATHLFFCLPIETLTGSKRIVFFVKDIKIINVAGFQKGIYFVEIKDLSGNILLSKKMIKD